MSLYLVPFGFYDPNLSDGIYESHINLFVVASSFDEAKRKAKSNSEFKDRKMHVDGMQEISRVSGFDIQLIEASGPNDTIVKSKRSEFTG